MCIPYVSEPLSIWSYVLSTPSLCRTVTTMMYWLLDALDVCKYQLPGLPCTGLQNKIALSSRPTFYINTMQNIVEHQSLLDRTTQTTMMKLVVLCLVLAAVRAEPGALFVPPLAAPLAYSAAAVVSPATTSISQQSSSVVHPSPYYYPAGYYPHFIKKRSATLALPAAYSTPLLGAAYSTYSTPLLSTAYAAPIAALPAAPIVAHAPLAYTHFIKKRSAPLLAPAAYIAPASYSHQSRVDVSHSPLITSYSSPLVYASPFAYPHFIKKRSAPLIASAAIIAPAATSYQTRADIRTSGPLITSYATPFAYASPLAYTHVY